MLAQASQHSGSRSSRTATWAALSPDVEPVEWILLTSLPLETFADAVEAVDDYTCR